MAMHPEFKPDSPLQSFLESSSTNQLVYDTCISVSEHIAPVVEPINAAKPENSLEAAIDSSLEPVIETAPTIASASHASVESRTSHQPD